MRSLLAGLALALLVVVPVSAQTTISVDPSSDLRLGGIARFNVVIGDKLKGYEYPMVLVRCYQGTDQVYAALGQPDADFLLGAGSSPWTAVGGPAECTAQVWAYVGLHRHHDERPLSEIIAFHADG